MAHLQFTRYKPLSKARTECIQPLINIGTYILTNIMLISRDDMNNSSSNIQQWKIFPDKILFGLRHGFLMVRIHVTGKETLKTDVKII